MINIILKDLIHSTRYSVDFEYDEDEREVELLAINDIDIDCFDQKFINNIYAQVEQAMVASVLTRGDMLDQRARDAGVGA